MQSEEQGERNRQFKEGVCERNRGKEYLAAHCFSHPVAQHLSRNLSRFRRARVMLGVLVAGSSCYL